MFGLAGVGIAALLMTACGTATEDAESGPTWVSPTTSSAPAKTAPARLAKVTSACKLLPAATVLKILGGKAGTKLSADELPVDKKPDGEVRHQCSYGRGGQEVLAVLVSTTPDSADTAVDSIDRIGQASGKKTTPVNDLGAAGVGYVDGDARILAVAVPYQKELRLLVVTGPSIVPHDRFVKVAQQVVPQL